MTSGRRNAALFGAAAFVLAACSEGEPGTVDPVRLERTAVERESLTSIDRSLRERDWELLDASLAWDGTLAAYADARGEKVTTFKVQLHRLRERLRVLVEAV